MSVSDPVKVALITVGAGAAGATWRGLWEFFTKRGDRTISAWEQWRKDNETLRAEIAELRKEIGELRTEIKLHQKDKDLAEEKCERLEIEVRAKDEAFERARQEHSAEMKAKEKEVESLNSQLNVALRAAELPEVAHRAAERERQLQKENTDP